MTPILDYLSTRRTGILTGLLVLVVLAALVQWLLWMLGWGRFSKAMAGAREAKPQTIRYVLAEFFVQIVNDFRHLLALVMVTIFAVMMLIATVPNIFKQGGPDMNSIKDGLQAVAAALGGLIGSIIGYYFGESAAVRRAGGGGAPAPETPQSIVQATPPPGGAAGADIRPPVRPSGSPGGNQPKD